MGTNPACPNMGILYSIQCMSPHIWRLLMSSVYSMPIFGHAAFVPISLSLLCPYMEICDVSHVSSVMLVIDVSSILVMSGDCRCQQYTVCPYLGMPHLCPYPCPFYAHIWRYVMSECDVSSVMLAVCCQQCEVSVMSAV